MKKHIIISGVIDLCLAALMAVGIIPSVWWIVFVVVILQLAISLIIGARKPATVTPIMCDHRFPTKEVLDLNGDPRCVRCEKFGSLIVRQEHARYQPCPDDPDFYTTVPR